MPSYLDTKTFADLVRIKRGNSGLREIAQVTGISASTISRVEREQTPDIETFLSLCDWLDVSPSSLIKTDKDNSKQDNCQYICNKLRTDKKLDSAIADALAILVKAAYSGSLS